MSSALLTSRLKRLEVLLADRLPPLPWSIHSETDDGHEEHDVDEVGSNNVDCEDIEVRSDFEGYRWHRVAEQLPSLQVAEFIVLARLVLPELLATREKKAKVARKNGKKGGRPRAR